MNTGKIVRWTTCAFFVIAGGVALTLAKKQRAHFPTPSELAIIPMTFRPSPTPDDVISAQAALNDLFTKGVLARYPSKTYRERYGLLYPHARPSDAATLLPVAEATPAWEIAFAVHDVQAQTNTNPPHYLVVWRDRTYFVDAKTGALLEAMSNHCSPCPHP